MWTELDRRCFKNVNGNWRQEFFVRCGCGATKWMSAGNFKKSKQCAACRKQQYAAESASWSKHPLHGIWYGVVSRCTNPKSQAYPNYGGRGITVCPEWNGSDSRQSFARFVCDMGDRPSKHHTLERLDNEKGYTKDNCKWATWGERANNRRNNVTATVDGATRTVAQWAALLGVPHAKILRPIEKYGIDASEVVATIARSPAARARWVSKTRRPHDPIVRLDEGCRPLSEECSARGIDLDWARKLIRGGETPEYAVMFLWFRKTVYAENPGKGGLQHIAEGRAKSWLSERGL